MPRPLLFLNDRQNTSLDALPVQPLLPERRGNPHPVLLNARVLSTTDPAHRLRGRRPCSPPNPSARNRSQSNGSYSESTLPQASTKNLHTHGVPVQNKYLSYPFTRNVQRNLPPTGSSKPGNWCNPVVHKRLLVNVTVMRLEQR